MFPLPSKLAPLVALVLLPLAVSAAEWPSFGNDPGGSQYSPLTQLTPRNIRQLRVAWEHRSGDIIRASGLNGTTYEVTPIVIDGRLYYCTPLNKVFALDAETGEELWMFDGTAGDAERLPAPCRGVAYWEAAEPDEGKPCQRRIFKGDNLARLWALDADTGKPCADFGADAGHPGYVSARDFNNHGEGWWIHTSPAAVYENQVIVGSALDDTLPNAQDGITRAFDARTGELLWSFNPIPAALSDRVGGGNAWSTLSVDEARGLVLIPTTSLSTDYLGGFRGSGSEYANAVVALDAVSGEVRWHRQLLRHNLFDYDLPGHPLLVTIRKDGRSREVAIQASKTGDIFVFDRATGEPVFPITDEAAPETSIDGEIKVSSQPRSLAIDSVVPGTLTIDDMFGLTVFDREWCRREFAKSRYDGLYTPPSEQGSIVYPSIRGGPNWGSLAYHPGENLLLVRADSLATRVRLFKPDDPANEPVRTDFPVRSAPVIGTDWWVAVEPFLSPLGVPCNAPPWGTLTAVDMNTGKHRWRIPLGQAGVSGLNVAEESGWGSPGSGGPIVTAGGLVLIAAGMDPRLRGFDIKTGELVWRAGLPAPGMAVPITYEAGGRQFVVIAAGGNAVAGTKLGDTLIAFAIPPR